MERRIPTEAEIKAYFYEDSNWGRWGHDDQLGAINLITPEKRIEAAKLVRSGRVVSLSRKFPKEPALNNPYPANHYIKWRNDEREFHVQDYIGIFYHGAAATHLDALCHEWAPNGMWNGRDPLKVIAADGVKWGSIAHWNQHIVTRCVLIDVPKHRGEPFVKADKPVHWWELEDIAKEEGVTVRPGDALAVYCGREAYDLANERPWGAGFGPGKDDARAGMHVSCVKFLRDTDTAVLLWDMKDHRPNGYPRWARVAAIEAALGIGIVDNSLLEPVAKACAEENRYEFMLTISPLVVEGGTGSPVNPLAIF